jgi:hypothetical protein
MMMGIGNLTELTDVDTAGVNVLLLGFCQEVGIRSVLTTEVIHWARSSVRECALGRALVWHAVANHTLPKHVEPRLVSLRAGKPQAYGGAALDRLAKMRRFTNIADLGTGTGVLALHDITNELQHTSDLHTQLHRAGGEYMTRLRNDAVGVPSGRVDELQKLRVDLDLLAQENKQLKASVAVHEELHRTTKAAARARARARAGAQGRARARADASAVAAASLAASYSARRANARRKRCH